MLKIKDNVELLHLNKFGFGFDVSEDDGQLYWWQFKLFVGEDRIIRQEDGINCFKEIGYQLSECEVEVLYDLIMAGLVEKVEE